MKRIMVVDDCTATLSQVVAVLERGGYATVHTDDPTESPMMILNEQPNALIVDLEMEGVSGWDLIALVRSWPQCRDLPILALAPRGAENMIHRAIAAGATDCLVKPIHEGLLIDHVATRFWPETKRVAGPTAADSVPRMATENHLRQRRPGASGSSRAVVAAKGLASATAATTAKPAWSVMGQRKP